MKYQNIYNRLRRIEGQIRGIGEMVSRDQSEPDILIQLEAAKSSISSTIAFLIESMLEKKEGDKVLLKETEFRAILRSVKKG